MIYSLHRIIRIHAEHIFPLFVSHPRQSKLVMISQEKCPLAGFWYLWGLLKNIEYREPVFHPKRHEYSWHQWEVESHMAYIIVSKVGNSVLRPLVCLSKKHLILILSIYMCPELPQEFIGFRQVFTVCSLSFKEIGDCIQAHSINPHIKPVIY